MPAQPDAVTTAVAALRAADDMKAIDPTLLDVSDVLGIVDLFAIITGTSERHAKALADEVERVLKQHHERAVLRREGTPASGWLVLDYGDVVVHVFQAEQRDVFGLERLWSDVPTLDALTGAVLDAGTPREPDPRDDLLVES